MTNLPVGFPTGPLIDPASGELTPSWRAFFLAVFLRTGGNAGIITTDTSTLSAEIAAETASRQTADANLTAAIAQERARAEAAEAAQTSALQVAVFQLQQAISGAATYVQTYTGLRAAWMALDLSVLPGADPGNGKPYLDGNHIAVGSGPLMLTESGVGHWITEDGAGAWQFG